MPQDKKQDKKQCLFLGGVRKASEVETLKLQKHPKVVFAGRSNVGKSSLLNALVGSKIARVSQSPGKTREMNFFSWICWGKPMILVDLPGYGYAKVTQSLRAEWGKEITKWLVSDAGIQLVVVLVDGRHGYQKLDLDLITFLQSEAIPFLVVMTKMDKWKSNNQKREAQKKWSQQSAEKGVNQFVFSSALSQSGMADLYNSLKTLFAS